MSNQNNDANEATTETVAPNAGFMIGAIVLAILFYLTPYLFGSIDTEIPSGSSTTGAKLVGDGAVLVVGHETLAGIQRGTSSLSETLTAPWWGQHHTESTLWRPVPLFVLGMASSMSGPYNPADPKDAPFPFHLLTLAAHVLATMLLFLLAFEFTKSDKAALIAAALFATLPVHGAAIFDVAGISELLAAAFGFGAWLMWLKAGDKPLTNAPMLLGCMVLVALAGLSNETAYILPILFFLVDAGRNPERGGIDLGFAMKKLPAVGALLVIVAVVITLRISVTGGLTSDSTVSSQFLNPLLAADGMDRIANGLRLLILSVPVMLGLNPLRGEGNGDMFGFSPDYSIGQIEVLSAFSIMNLLAIVALFASIGVAIVLGKKCGLRAGLWLAVLASLVLGSNVLFAADTMFSERSLYFPSGILVLIIAMFLAKRGKAGLIAGLLLAVAGGTWTYARADAWTTTMKYVEQVEVSAPKSALAALNTGMKLEQDALFDTAATSYRRALEIFPSYTSAEVALGRVLEEDLNFAEAANRYQRALEIQLEDAEWAYVPETFASASGPATLINRITNLRAFNPAVDQPQANLDWFDGLLAKGYDSPPLRTHRARTLLKLARVPEAEADYKASLAIQPTAFAVRYYGDFLRRANRTDEALELYDANSRLTDAFIGIELAEFLLQRADAELMSDPAKAVASAEEAQQHGQNMTAEQVFRTHWTWVQGTLESLPEDARERVEARVEIDKRLKNALTFYTDANEVTYAARYTLVSNMRELGNHAELIPVAEEMLRFRPAANLRTWLAEAYMATGDTDKGIENWKTACAGLVTEDGTPADIELLLGARRNLLSALSSAGRVGEVHAEIEGWHMLAGGEDMWALALAADWEAGWGDVALAGSIAAHLATTYPDFPDGANYAAKLATYSAPAPNNAALLGLAQNRIGWGNFAGTVDAAEAALAVASADMEKVSAIGILANALAKMGRLDVALIYLDQALSLDLPAELKANIQRTRNQIADN
jgi:tetratricopeptide (TPR) repeat protein